jgi:hypothetical protein
MRTRREFLALGGCVVCATVGNLSSRPGKAEPIFEGCCINPAVFDDFLRTKPTMASASDASLFARDRHLRTTGDRYVDRELDRAMGMVADLMKVRPAFGFYEPGTFFIQSQLETWRMNAWATPRGTDIVGTKGTVCFGTDLFRQEFYEHDRTGTTVITIIAHEFAHIAQFDRGRFDTFNKGDSLKREINADYLAGYFLGTRMSQNPGLEFKKAGEYFIRQGNSEDGKANRTHGNSKERLDAAEAGFRLAYLQRKTFDEAWVASLEYVGEE